MRHHRAAIVGDTARTFFQERISGPTVVSLVGRLFAAGSVWLGKDSEDRLFVAIDPLLSEPVGAEVMDRQGAPNPDSDAGITMPATIQVAGGLLKSRALTSRDYSLISTHASDLVAPTQEMVDQLIGVLEEFKAEERGHFDPEMDEPIEFMAMWRGELPNLTALGYWAGLSPNPEDAHHIHFRGRGTWVSRLPAEAPPAESIIRVHPSHWLTLTRAIDDKDVIADAALMLLPVAPSGGGFMVQDLPAGTAERLAQAHVAHGGTPDDPLGVFLDGRAEWSSDLLLAILLDLANDRPVRLHAQRSTEEAVTAPAAEDQAIALGLLPPRREHEAVEVPVAPANSSWTTLADYAIELAGTRHLDEPEACGDRECAIFHAALALMNQSRGAQDDAEMGSDSYWTQFAIRELMDDAMRSLTQLGRPFPAVYLEVPPGPFVQWYRAWVPPIHEAHERTLEEFARMLAGLYSLTYPDQAGTDLSENALRHAGFQIPDWRDPLDDL